MGRLKTPDNKKLSNALGNLLTATGSDRGIVKGAELSQKDRELLLRVGYLREMIKGWYFISDPSSDDGDTTPFFANYWEYISRYLKERFDDNYCLSAEHSLLLQAENNVIPKQISVTTEQKVTQKVELYGDYSIFIYHTPQLIEQEFRKKISGVQVMSPAACLVSLGPKSYESNSADIQIVMNTISSPFDIVQLINRNAAGVGRVIGAYKQIGNTDFADQISSSLKSASVNVPLIENPFNKQPVIYFKERSKCALSSRINMLWENNREVVLSHRPSDATLDILPSDYDDAAEKIKVYDAYHSLSIERYRVTPELIARIASGEWNPKKIDNNSDNDQVNAMAALGYLRAFEKVKEGCVLAFSGEQKSAEIFRKNHHDWFAQLFSPSVDAGLYDRGDLMGYRRQMVIIKRSQHAPPHFDYVADGMSALIYCMSNETDPFVNAVLSHWLIGYIHPFIDGNGRMARFTMNLMLAEGGYPWIVIEVSDRDRYMQALESASVKGDIAPLASLLSDNILRTSDKIQNEFKIDGIGW